MPADGVYPTARDERGHTALTALCAAAAPEVVAREWREDSKAAEMGCSLGEALGLDEGLPAGACVATLHQVLALIDATPALLWTPDARGRLPLHWAVASGRIELVLLLTRAVRDLEAKDETTDEEMVLAERALTGVDDFGSVGLGRSSMVPPFTLRGP